MWLLAGVLVLGVGLGVAVVGIVAQGGDDGTGTVSNTVQAPPRINGQQSQEQPAREDGTASGGTQTAPTQTSDQEFDEQPDQGDGAAVDDAQTPSSTASVQQPQGRQLGEEELADLRQRIQSGEVTQEELAELRQRFQGAGGDGTGFFGGGGLTGTVQSVQGNVVTAETSQGPSQATVGADTNIQKTDRGTLEDLVIGVRVTVVGQRGADGTFQADSISILPEGNSSDRDSVARA